MIGCMDISFGSRLPRTGRVLLISLSIFLAVVLGSRAESREEVLQQAMAYWILGDGGAGAVHPLKAVGDIKLGAPSDGPGASGAPVARMRGAYFDAGPSLNVTGSQITVYLRVRDPYGQWMHALMAKRGRHETINFNLFGADFDRTQGPDIGFELYTDAGLALCSFPISELGSLAWHDLVGRYNGTLLELICDGVVMDRVRWKGPLTTNNEPLLIGAQTDDGRVEAPFTGEMEEAGVWNRALSDDEVALLVRKNKLTSHPECPEAAEPYASPIHFRPAVGKIGDTIPFYWNGQYHVYYLRATAKMCWDHIVSTDLVHWVRKPAAILPDGDPLGPCGENIGTGSIIETGGVFHAFFTGWNPRNPRGREVVGHATSTNLDDWVKDPKAACEPDGVMYKNHHERDFRDPYVFWNDEEQCWWLLIFANDGQSGAPVVGVFSSGDLAHWTPRPPVASFSGQECPDCFRIGDTYYLLGGFRYGHAAQAQGPYHMPDNPYLDTPFLYAGKRMFDGRRHVWTAWFRDLAGERDNGAFEWGGTQCLPRELYAGPGGELYARPVDEVTAVFTQTALDLANHPPLTPAPRWEIDGSILAGVAEHAGSQQAFDVPDNYMLQCTIELDPKAEFSVVFREQPLTGDGYRLIIRPSQGIGEINGRGFRYPRKCVIDAGRPIKLQAFVQGTMIETFINDQYAFSCRAYDFARGKLGLNVSGGSVRVSALTVKTHE